MFFSNTYHSKKRQHLAIATEGGGGDGNGRQQPPPLSSLVAAVVVTPLRPPCQCWQAASVTRLKLTVYLPHPCRYVGPGGRQRRGWWSMGAIRNGSSSNRDWGEVEAAGMDDGDQQSWWAAEGFGSRQWTMMF